MDLIKTTTPQAAEPTWADVLNQLSSRARPEIVDDIARFFAAEFSRGRITTPLRQAHFLAQAACETNGFTTLTEYGSAAYFRRYDGRKDLGNLFPGDGFRFRGRGIFQNTGRRNYAALSHRRGVNLIKTPEWAASGSIAVPDAVDYWTDHHCNVPADRDDIVEITRKINGGLNGLSTRRLYLARAKHILGVAVHAQGLTALPEPMDPARITAVQAQLKARGYHMVGEPDGQVGSSTVAAVAAFQHDNQIPTTGEIDDTTENELFAADDQRDVSDDRANGVPQGSRIMSHGRSLLLGAKAAIGVGGVGATSDILDQAEGVQDNFLRTQNLLAPFHSIGTLLVGHIGIVVLATGIILAVLATKIISARVDDYQSGKTP